MILCCCGKGFRRGVWGYFSADFPKVLTTRLRELEESGVVERKVMPTSPPSVQYELNELGRRLVPAIEAIAAVGEELKQRGAGKEQEAKAASRHKHFRAARASGSAG